MTYDLKLRSMLVAGKGKVLIACDFSQAETWIVAHLANEKKMIHSLTQGDIHRETAANALFHVPEADVTSDMRYLGKRFNHASSYQMGYQRAAEVINKDSDKAPFVTVTLAEAKKYSEAWRSYYELQTWWNGIREKLNNNRTLVSTYGRRMIFNGQWGEKLEKEATAWEPQSTVGDHANGAIHPEIGIAGGFLEVYRTLVKRERAGRIINQSHDSIVFETNENLASELAPRIVTLLHRPLIVNYQQFYIPVDCEIGERYGELKKQKVA